MNIGTCRTALAAGVTSVAGLKCSAYLKDQVNPPDATLNLKGIEYDVVFADGKSTYTFALMVYAGRTSELAAQALLDGYCQPLGATSVKAALEDPAVGTATGADFVDVKRVNGVGVAIVGAVEYLAVEFEIEVIG